MYRHYTRSIGSNAPDCGPLTENEGINTPLKSNELATVLSVGKFHVHAGIFEIKTYGAYGLIMKWHRLMVSLSDPVALLPYGKICNYGRRLIGDTNDHIRLQIFYRT